MRESKKLRKLKHDDNLMEESLRRQNPDLKTIESFPIYGAFSQTHIVEVDDYHEFSFVENNLQKAFPTNKVKVKEIDFCNGFYKGIAYLDRQDEAYKELEKELGKEIKEWEKCFI